MTVNRWSDQVEEILPEILGTQQTLTDLEYETFMSLMQTMPGAPPIPCMIIMLLVTSPVINDPPVTAQAVFPIGGTVVREKMEVELRKLVEMLAQERSNRLNQALARNTGSSIEKTPGGLILGR